MDHNNMILRVCYADSQEHSHFSLKLCCLLYGQNALGVFLAQDKNETPDSLRMGWDELEDTFGDRLVMLSSEETEYALCSI
jgi:hypothetical protein